MTNPGLVFRLAFLTVLPFIGICLVDFGKKAQSSFSESSRNHQAPETAGDHDSNPPFWTTISPWHLKFPPWHPPIRLPPGVVNPDTSILGTKKRKKALLSDLGDGDIIIYTDSLPGVKPAQIDSSTIRIPGNSKYRHEAIQTIVENSIGSKSDSLYSISQFQTEKDPFVRLHMVEHALLDSTKKIPLETLKTQKKIPLHDALKKVEISSLPVSPGNASTILWPDMTNSDNDRVTKMKNSLHSTNPKPYTLLDYYKKINSVASFRPSSLISVSHPNSIDESYQSRLPEEYNLKAGKSSVFGDTSVIQTHPSKESSGRNIPPFHWVPLIPGVPLPILIMHMNHMEQLKRQDRRRKAGFLLLSNDSAGNLYTKPKFQPSSTEDKELHDMFHPSDSIVELNSSSRLASKQGESKILNTGALTQKETSIVSNHPSSIQDIIQSGVDTAAMLFLRSQSVNSFITGKSADVRDRWTW